MEQSELWDQIKQTLAELRRYVFYRPLFVLNSLIEFFNTTKISSQIYLGILANLNQQNKV